MGMLSPAISERQITLIVTQTLEPRLGLFRLLLFYESIENMILNPFTS